MHRFEHICLSKFIILTKLILFTEKMFSLLCLVCQTANWTWSPVTVIYIYIYMKEKEQIFLGKMYCCFAANWAEPLSPRPALYPCWHVGPSDSFVPNITLAWMRLFAPASSKKKIICSSLNFTLSYSLRGPLNKRCGLTSIIASPIDST